MKPPFTKSMNTPHVLTLVSCGLWLPHNTVVYSAGHDCTVSHTHFMDVYTLYTLPYGFPGSFKVIINICDNRGAVGYARNKLLVR